MKLILGVDAIFPPLTGIGRYAWELATRLPLLGVADDIRYFSMGRWVGDPHTLLATGLNEGSRRGISVAVRRRLAAFPWAVRAYSRFTPILYKHRLRGFGDYLFHSPNYFLPPVAGPSVATFHDLSIYKFAECHPQARIELMHRQLPITLKRANHLITDSEATRKEVIEFFSWPAERITAVPLGVDPAFAPRTEYQTQATLARHHLTHGRYTLCVATLEPRKNLPRLIEAYRLLSMATRRQYPLVLAGGRGWEIEALLAQIEAAQREGWLHYLGFVAEAELPDLFAGARCFAFPSLYEGFGLPVLEAMASGVPVVTSTSSSLPEVAGKAALLVDAEDTEAISAALAKALEDDKWRALAVDVGIQRAQSFSWDRCVAATAAVYSTAIPV